jgi:hypothetical protein
MMMGIVFGGGREVKRRRMAKIHSSIAYPEWTEANPAKLSD